MNMEIGIEEEGTPVGNPENIVLTEREILLAQGDDPDVLPVDADTEGSPAVEDGLQDTGDAPSDPPAEENLESWITASDMERAKAYGLAEDDLALFENREEFGRWAKLTDRASSRGGQPRGRRPDGRD
jgi:hypothetical protein